RRPSARRCCENLLRGISPTSMKYGIPASRAVRYAVLRIIAGVSYQYPRNASIKLPQMRIA
ncbi:MAG: hypothetical protein NT176_20270, partial [Proteobacteria bacterium]|nr:hypothetical protein [Pseudomonadota bacterium]